MIGLQRSAGLKRSSQAKSQVYIGAIHVSMRCLECLDEGEVSGLCVLWSARAYAVDDAAVLSGDLLP